MNVTVSSDRHHDPAVSDRTLRRVLVGVDGSPAGRAALMSAGRDAARDGLRVVALHVRRGLTPVEALGSAFAGVSGACWLDCRDDAELSAWLDCVQILETAGVRWQFEVREGEPVTELQEAAEAFSVRSVYLAARIRTWWGRQLHHCPARALARHACCPVHVISYSDSGVPADGHPDH